ncbi:MAG: glycosyltransferase family 2 protein [Proteobacteria bacterium]|nr:glycosyltransferase family 2 protein [Pseudomonadota bacterium]
MREPVVTVCIPTFDRERTVGAAIESVLAQTFEDFELLVLDDASTDGTVALASSYARSDPRVRVVPGERNAGTGVMRQRGLELARGHYVANLDSDDRAHPERLARQVAYLDAHPDCALLGTWARRVGVGDRPRGLYRRPLSAEAIRARLLFENCFKNTTVTGRRDVLQKFGYRPLRVCEDVDLHVRIALVHPVANLPEVLGVYRKHKRSVSAGEAAQLEIRAAQIRIARDLLQGLGLKPSQTDLDRHHELRELAGPAPDRPFVDWAEPWLRGLHAANQRARVYPEPEFSRVLGARWRQVCRAAALPDGEALARCVASPLAALADAPD